MAGSIRLSKTRGVNPAMGVCPLCGKENGEILLVGAGIVYKCNNCGTKIIGKHGDSKCPDCGYSNFDRVGEFDSYRDPHVTGSLCDECKKKLKVADEEVKKGGVPWRCSVCKSEGVITHDSEFAINFRKKYPAPTGIELNSEQCPICRGI